MNRRQRMIKKVKEEMQKAERRKKALLNSNRYTVGILGMVPSISYLALHREDRTKINLATVKLTNVWKKIIERRQELA